VQAKEKEKKKTPCPVPFFFCCPDVISKKKSREEKEL
jgi:hypothetical protein